MSDSYTGSNAGPIVVTYTIPTDGDDVNAVSVNIVFQPNADNWQYAKRVFPDLLTGGTWTFTTAIATSNQWTFNGAVYFNSPVEIGNSTGFTFDNGTSLVIGAFTHFTYAGPAATADPGVNNSMSGANVPKMWAYIYTTGGGSHTVTIGDGYNIATAVVRAGTGSTIIDVTFARPMLSTAYAVCVTGMDGASYLGSAYNIATGGFSINLSTSSIGTAIDLTTGVYHFGVVVFGRQT